MRNKKPKPVISVKNKKKQKDSRFTKNPKITIFFIILFSVIFIDIIAGLFFIPKDYNTFRCSDKYYHHDFIPNKEVTTKWGNRTYSVFTNSLGFRDEAIRDITLKTSKKRIVFLGDSYVEGLGVTYNESFTGLLNNRIDTSELEILNASAVSYSPKLYYLKTKYLIENKGLKFDELFVFIDISDIQDEIFYKTFEPGKTNSFKDFFYKLNKFFKRNSFIYYSISNLSQQNKGISNTFYAEEKANINVWFENIDGYLDKKNPEEGRFIWTINETVFNKWGKEGLRLSGNNMKMLNELCEQYNIELTIVIYPSPYQIYSKDLDSKQVRYWREFSEKYKIAFINLFPDFINNSKPEDIYNKYFIQGDTHWNPEGHKLIADRLVDFIKD